jgi:outer membrane protein
VKVWVFLMMALLAPWSMAESAKIAVVDMERALFNSEAAKASAEQFQADNKADIDKLKVIRSDVAALNEKLEKEGDIMSEEERRKQAEKINAQREEYQYYARKLQQQENNWKRGFFESKLPELEKILKGLIEEGEYDIVLQAGTVVFASPKVDLTSLLLERLNAK